jgi:hypothetical protein
MLADVAQDQLSGRTHVTRRSMSGCRWPRPRPFRPRAAFRRSQRPVCAAVWAGAGVSPPDSPPDETIRHMGAVLLLLDCCSGRHRTAIGYLLPAVGPTTAATCLGPGRGRADPRRRRKSQDDRRGAAERLRSSSRSRAFQALSAQALDASTSETSRSPRGPGGERERGGRTRDRRAAVEHLVGPLRKPWPGSRATAGVRRGQDPVARRAGRAGRHRAAELGTATCPDAGAGHRAARRRRPGAGVSCSYAGWSSWPG